MKRILQTLALVAATCFGVAHADAQQYRPCGSSIHNGTIYLHRDCNFPRQQAGHNGSNGRYFIGQAMQQRRAMEMRRRYEVQRRQMMSRQYQRQVRIQRTVSRTHSAPVPNAQAIYARVQHRVTRAWAPCVAGYDQDPASGNCTRTVWRPGPMPMD